MMRRSRRLSVVGIQLWPSMLMVVRADTYTRNFSSSGIWAVSSGLRPWMPSISRIEPGVRAMVLPRYSRWPVWKL